MMMTGKALRQAQIILKGTPMHSITIEQAAAILETAQITTTIDLGHVVINHGVTEAGVRFALMNDSFGNSVLSESL